MSQARLRDPGASAGPAAGGFSVNKTFPIDLLDVNDAAITDVQLAAGEEAPEVAETVVAGVSALLSASIIALKIRHSGPDPEAGPGGV